MNRKGPGTESTGVRAERPNPIVAGGKTASGGAGHGRARLFDSSIAGTAEEAFEFIANILESSTEYSVIAKDLTGKILLWNEGARRLYGYEPEEVIGKSNSSILHAPEDVEGWHTRTDHAVGARGREMGRNAYAPAQEWRSVYGACGDYAAHGTPSANPSGFLLISKDISDEIRLTQYARSLIEASVDPLVTISPEGQNHRRERGDGKVTGARTRKADRRGLRGLFHRAGKGSRRLPASFFGGFRHRLPADHPPCGWTADGRAVQRLGLQRRPRQRAGSIRRRPRYHRTQEGGREVSCGARSRSRRHGDCE